MGKLADSNPWFAMMERGLHTYIVFVWLVALLVSVYCYTADSPVCIQAEWRKQSKIKAEVCLYVYNIYKNNHSFKAEINNFYQSKE